MTTPLDALVAALHDAAGYNPGAESAPEAVLWCDPNRDFATLLPALRERLPELLTYGARDPTARTGPAVWLRAAVARALPDLPLADAVTPILYLPAIGRDVLKGAEDCPTLLQPLVWLTVAGSLFGHVNGKDWTLRAFLASERGPLKLDIADDGATRAAMVQAATRFFVKPVAELHGKRWDFNDLNSLVAPDLPSDMLDWMDGGLDAGADPARFDAFANISTRELKFDPRKLSRQDAARRFAKREGRWDEVWSRFATTTGRSGVVGLLWSEEPGSLFENLETYPKQNVKGEDELRAAMGKLADASPVEARARLVDLDRTHAWRRETVWARRGEAPLANALAALATVAKAPPLPAHDGTALAEAYADGGAAVDAAAMTALATVSREMDRAAVSTALRAVYLPWLDEGALALQNLIRDGKVTLARPEKTGPSTTILFVDGLRMDTAQEIERLLLAEGLKVDTGWRWSGFPTVTSTCKPLVSPVATSLEGRPTTSDLAPVTTEGKAASKPVLYKLLDAGGWETGNSLLPDAKLWVETGRFDELGHALGAGLAGQLAICLRDVVDRVLQLAQAGRSVRIVTDHGWLLMPGGLPKAALEPGLVEPQGKRSRCALVKSKAETTYLQIPWSWNANVLVATATGARAFFEGQEYAHGGVSPQECVLPVLDVYATGSRPRTLDNVKARWEGLRLRVEVSGGADLRVDLRLGEETGGSSLSKGGRVLDDTGKTSFLVGDEHEGEAACLVVLDDAGNVLAHRILRVGGG